MHTFETPGPTALAVRVGAGRVTVTAEETAHTTVELTPLNAAGEDAVREAVVEQRGGSVLVDVPRHRGGLFRPHPAVAISVSLPRDSAIEVKAEAADVTARGTFAEASVTSGSGEVRVGEVTGAARLKSGSGAVVVDSAGASASLTVGSGDIRIGQVVGETVARTGSGDVQVDRLDGSLVAKSGSGDLVVRQAAGGSVRANGASGSISIGVPEGTAAWLDVSTLTGRVSQELEQAGAPAAGQQRVEITAHTVSGNLRVHRS